MAAFRLLPAARKAVHEKEAGPVAEVQQFRSGRNVRADGVATRFLQADETVRPEIVHPGGAERPEVVGQPDAPDGDRVPVQIEAILPELRVPETETGNVTIYAIRC